jgi:hypothetical protein
MVMKEIALTQNEVTLVDDEDFEWLNKWKWCLSRHTSRKIKAVVKRARYSDGMTRILPLHRLLMGLQYGDKQMVDHINGNPLDNRKDNLRVCNKSENGCNRGKPINNTSGYKGVHLHKETGKWRAEIRHKGKRHSLGLHATPELASDAYVKATMKYHGKFAYLYC